MARWYIGFLPLALVAACGDDGKNEDPLATVAGFCEAWAERACNADVVDVCSQEPDRDDCIDGQADFCRTLVKASKYNKSGARECLDAVEEAYADARITAGEFQVVRHLAVPCDQVIGADGVFCKKDSDCDTEKQLCQEREGSATGVCVIDGGRSCKDTELSCAQGFFCNGSICAEIEDSGGECASDIECKPEYRCVIPEDAETGTCKARADVDEACTTDDDCKSHLCWEDKCANRIVLTDSDELCKDLR